MAHPISISLTITDKEPLKLLTHVTYRYSQALLRNNTLRYFKAGVMLKDGDIDYEHIKILFSTKRVSKPDNEYVRKTGHKTHITCVAKVDEIKFKGNTYVEFSRRIGIELITIDSCEIDITTGKVFILGDMDSELSMSTFEFSYPLGQPKLIKD